MIVEKIVQKDLRRKHGEKWQEHRRSGHAEHVAKIRTGAHEKVFEDIGRSVAPFKNPVMKNIQTGPEQNDVRRVATPRPPLRQRRCQHRQRAATEHR